MKMFKIMSIYVLSIYYSVVTVLSFKSVIVRRQHKFLYTNIKHVMDQRLRLLLTEALN